jgi:hypothetical protein
MANIVKSVSLTITENEFLVDYELSPTMLLREKIWEMKGALKKLAQAKIDKMIHIIKEQSENIITLQDVLEENGIEAPQIR